MGAPFLPGRGFDDPVFGSQIVFRQVMRALSRPGTRVDVESLGVISAAAIPGSMLAVLLTLCDYETPIWLDAELRDSQLRQWLAFHCGAPLVDRPDQAAFAVLRRGGESPDLAAFSQGDERYPERSTTALVLCDSLDGGAEVTLRGPGIKDSATIAPSGLTDTFWAQARRNAARSPRGVDLLLLAGEGLIGLPRSTRITMAGGEL